MKSYLFAIQKFWSHHPLLLIGISQFLGILLGLGKREAWIALGFLLAPLIVVRGRELLISLLIVLLVTFWVAVDATYTSQDMNRWEGTLHFHPITLEKSSSKFMKGFKAEGVIKSFKTNEETFSHNLPCSILFNSSQRPLCNNDLQLEGTLVQTKQEKWILKLKKNSPIIPIPGTWSLAELRFCLKNSLREMILRKKGETHAKNFLGALLTGNFDDELLTHELRRFGLQHLLAISGFHFALVTLFFITLLRLFFSIKWAASLLLLLMTFFLLFLGPSPSVMRSWVMCSLAVCEELLERKGSSLNSMGGALILILLLFPEYSLHLGLHLSFGVTASILFFYSSIEKGLHILFKKRKLTEALTFSFFHQHIYLLGTFLRKAFALNLAVSLAALPMTFFINHQFSWLSLIFNLFFPALVAVSLILLFTALIMGIILEPMGDLIHTVNNYYTESILQLVYGLPVSLDLPVLVPSFSPVYLILYLCVLFLIGVKVHNRQMNEKQSFRFI